MDETEVQIQKYLINFVKYLPCFVSEWKEILQNGVRPVHGLVNQAEQMRHVESAMKDNAELLEMQQRLLYKVYDGIEEDILLIKRLVDKMNKVTSSMKNKITLLENETLNLNWNDEHSTLIKGSPSQPALELLLDYIFDFWLFFSSATKNINATLKSMNCRDVQSMNELENSFKVNLDDTVVLRLIAITQYIDNEKSIN